jgi:hypothetical protein
MSFIYNRPSVDITCDKCGEYWGCYCLKTQGEDYARIRGWRIGKTCLCPNCNPRLRCVQNPADSELIQTTVLEGRQ